MDGFRWGLDPPSDSPTRRAPSRWCARGATASALLECDGDLHQPVLFCGGLRPSGGGAFYDGNLGPRAPA